MKRIVQSKLPNTKTMHDSNVDRGLMKSDPLFSGEKCLQDRPFCICIYKYFFLAGF